MKYQNCPKICCFVCDLSIKHALVTNKLNSHNLYNIKYIYKQFRHILGSEYNFVTEHPEIVKVSNRVYFSFKYVRFNRNDIP